MVYLQCYNLPVKSKLYKRPNGYALFWDICWKLHGFYLQLIQKNVTTLPIGCVKTVCTVSYHHYVDVVCSIVSYIGNLVYHIHAIPDLPRVLNLFAWGMIKSCWRMSFLEGGGAMQELLKYFLFVSNVFEVESGCLRSVFFFSQQMKWLKTKNT